MQLTLFLKRKTKIKNPGKAAFYYAIYLSNNTQRQQIYAREEGGTSTVTAQLYPQTLRPMMCNYHR